MTYSMTQALFFRTVLTACVIGSATFADADRLTLPVQTDDRVALALGGQMDHDPSDILQVFVGNVAACCTGKTPVAGHYHIDGSHLMFDPVFDFIEGQSYTVLWRMADADLTLTAFTIDAGPKRIAPDIVAVYPSGPHIPENTLRFYIDFATPMTPHVAMDFIRLLDANGTPDTAAFMSFKQELWNNDRTRLTLLMDPGRIKRGVATNVALGPALIAGHQYTLKVDAGWQAAQGAQKAGGFEHRFSVTAPLRHLPDTGLWQFENPRLGTRDPLRITFDRPFDQQMAQSAITVLDANGHAISGAVSLEDAEQTWRFIPNDIWTTPTLSVRVDATLEDVAGNNLRELLDHTVGSPTRAINQQTVTLTLGPSPE